MKPIHLDNFEREIKEIILNRGFCYFEDSKVSLLSKFGDSYVFRVEGTDVYEVKMIVSNGIVADYECSCPYDMGPVCKHIAACLYYVTDSQGDNNKRFPGNEYEDCIIKLIRNASNRHGFIFSEEAEYLSESFQNLIDIAENAKDSQKCIDICLPMISLAFDALERADDSYGEISTVIDNALDALGVRSLDNSLKDSSRKQVINFCITEFLSNKYKGYSWNTTLLELAADFSVSIEDVYRVMEMVKQSSNTEHFSEIEEETIEAIKFSLLQKISNDDSEKFLNSHISNPKLRRFAINRAIKTKNYQDVYRIADDGVSCNASDKPGLVHVWKEMKLKAALALKDEPEVLSLAQDLWIDGHGGLYDDDLKIPDYYSFLKKRVPEDEWKVFIHQFLSRYENEKHYLTNAYADILVREEMWDKLLSFVKHQENGEIAKEYEKFLKGEYKTELIQIYTDSIYQVMKSRKLNREVYQRVCSYLRHIKKLGGKQEMSVIVTDLKFKYPGRPALLDELEGL